MNGQASETSVMGSRLSPGSHHRSRPFEFVAARRGAATTRVLILKQTVPEEPVTDSLYRRKDALAHRLLADLILPSDLCLGHASRVARDVASLGLGAVRCCPPAELARGTVHEHLEQVRWFALRVRHKILDEPRAPSPVASKRSLEVD